MTTAALPKPRPTPALQAAVRKAGSQARLAQLIGCKQSSVHEMLRTGRVRAEFAVNIERHLGISAERLNPAIAEFARLRGLRRGRAQA